MGKIENKKKPYRSVADYLAEISDAKIRKVSLNVGFSCPNRGGPKGRGGCVYCSEFGSASRNARAGGSIVEQLRLGKSYYKKQYANNAFLAYFQAFTPTYGPLDVLGAAVEAALSEPDMIGYVVSTRPDCLGPEVLELFQGLGLERLFWLELGLQSSHQKSLDWMNRGHSIEDFESACERANRLGIPLVAHVILGVPGESRRETLDTARYLAGLPLQGVKIHQLQAIPGTVLGKRHEQGEFSHLGFEEYRDLLIDFLELLPPEFVIHRLVGEHDRSTKSMGGGNELSSAKMTFLIQKAMAERGAHQGRLY